MVSSINDAKLVGRHSRLGGTGNIKSLYHRLEYTNRLTRCRAQVAAQFARCQESDSAVQNEWRTVCFAGLAGGDGSAFILVEHEGVERCEVVKVLQRRWPEVVLKNLDNETPTSTIMTDDAADLARFRRGVEPLRLVVLPQRDSNRPPHPVDKYL
jgi:hypothetical protein